ncbi:MAG: protein-glutamate O-methyltransferase CheR [Bacteroidales bacterium]|nr:protein-glutamate O-methyltransferase CheR [Bacteroidales bacterium]
MRDNQDIYEEIRNIEIRLLLEAIYQRYGYDFRNYSFAHLKRRIVHRLSSMGLKSVSQLQHYVLHDHDTIQQVLMDLSINVTEMFRDPSFYKKVREEVIPILKTYPYFKIWHAGCATGEEVYSMAIILKEEGLYDRAQIYATDFNQKVIKKAKEGIYSIENIKQYTTNYQKAGGKESFSNYYTAHYDSVIMDESLKNNILFADHNLVTDGIFSEVNMIICRNVLIYFERDLQDHAIKTFLDSLLPGGILCLGSKETLQFSKYYPNFNQIDAKEKIYRKKYTIPE